MRCDDDDDVVDVVGVDDVDDVGQESEQRSSSVPSDHIVVRSS